MEFKLLKTDLLKAFEKKVTASVRKCFKDLSEAGFMIQYFKHYMPAGAATTSQTEGSTSDLNIFFT